LSDSKKVTAEERLYLIRHSLAHVMAQAVLRLKPKAKLAFGPPVDNGFYYDFDFGEDEALTPEDFPQIEEFMREIIKEKQVFEQHDESVSEAVEKLEAGGEVYKAEYARELAEQGEESLGFYKNGDFEDMCRGPHVEHTGQIRTDCFKVDSLAGAYWRGDEKRQQLTRVYGIAFEDKKKLKEFLKMRELARERDHRKLGAEMSLFVIDDDVGQGLPLWLPNGAVVRDELEAFAKEIEFRQGYKQVHTPHITKENLYVTSGHLPYYKEGMYPAMKLDEDEPYYLKPMNCPHHHKIFAAEPRSYRDLPLRLAEYGTCYRYEDSGALAGLLRVRMLNMNDAHIYCSPEQLRDEFRAVLELHRFYYEKFKLSDYWMRLSTHDPEKKSKYVDNPDAWLQSEQVIREVLEEMSIPFESVMGEAAFYGPKVDFQIKNVVGREETASTNQLDFAVPERFELQYRGQDGKDYTPYCIHRAPLGTHERFIAFLIEHFGGAFPTWMAPRQVAVIPVGEKFIPYAESVCSTLREQMIRAEVDQSGETFNKKVRNAITSKTPNLAIVGGNEMEGGTVTWRRYGRKKQESLELANFTDTLKTWVSERQMDNFD